MAPYADTVVHSLINYYDLSLSVKYTVPILIPAGDSSCYGHSIVKPGKVKVVWISQFERETLHNRMV